MSVVKIALIGSGVSSGGLVSMLKDFLSFSPLNADVALFCSRQFSSQYAHINPAIKVVETEALIESKWAQLFKKNYSREFVRLVRDYQPDVVFYITGSSKDGLDDYNSYIVLNNQLYTSIPRLLKQKSLKVFLTTLVNAYSFRRRAKRISHIFFSSEYSREESLSVLHINDSIVVPFACNREFYLDKTPDVKLLGKTLYLLNVGSIIPYKNQLAVVEGLRVLKERNVDFKMTFVGRPLSRSYYKKCKDKVNEYNLSDSIEFIDWLNPSQIREQIDSCDIYINSSETDTCATSVEEGMARCKPVIASETPFNKEMVRDGGLYFPLDQPTKLADEIIKYINDDDLRNNMAVRGYELSKKWTLKDTARAYYDKIIRDVQTQKKRDEC